MTILLPLVTVESPSRTIVTCHGAEVTTTGSLDARTTDGSNDRVPRQLGIGHLTMLDISPPDLVSAAAAAGFDFVGLRVAAGGPGEELWPVTPGSAMLRETLRRLDDTGLYVNEVDVLPIRPGTTPADAEPTFEIAALLAARYLIAFVEDTNLTRVGDVLNELSELAAAHRLRILIEPMSYQQVRTFAQADRILRAAPAAGIVVDPLQFIRSGDTLDDVRALDPAVVPLLQLCDGPLVAPTDLPHTSRLPRGQSPGTSTTQLEARAWRLPAGEGEMPLAELASLLPDARISIEAPNLGLSRLLDPVALTLRHRAGLDLILGSPLAASARATG
jgi:sugar phosphate isomerase/epimerase